MKKLRMSVTTLESYRRYIAEHDEQLSMKMLSDLIESIKGKFVETEYMRKGKAFHEILEDPDKHRYNLTTYIAHAISFPADSIHAALTHCEEGGVHEYKRVCEYVTSNWIQEPVDVVAKCDHLVGNLVYEHKTKWSETPLSSYDADKVFDSYTASAQWKFYCEHFHVDTVQYNVFVLNPYTHGLHETLPFRLQAYDGMAEELQGLVSDFTDFIYTNDLQQHFIK